MRVGRGALDEEAIRVLEEAHPDVPFDWSRMLKEKPPPAPLPGGFDEGPRRRRGGKARPQPARPVRPVAVVVEPPTADEEEEPETPVGEMDIEAPEPDVAVRDLAEMHGVEPDEIEAEAGEPEIEREGAPMSVPHQDFFEPEVLMRLRARYAELKARIAQRIADPAQRDVLRAEAERLNPDTWVTDEEARTGLEQFERWFEAIRMQLPAPRRRRRRKRRGGQKPPAP